MGIHIMIKPSGDRTLNEVAYRRGIDELAGRDPDLSDAVRRWGNPPFWVHPPGFAGIVIAILSQQVSLESAHATFTKLQNAVGTINPENFLTLDDSTLRKIGFSRQKIAYIRAVAHDILADALDLEALASMDNEQARKKLITRRGIGPWTADTYLLFALRRSDAWPSGDLALVKAVRKLKGLLATPSFEEVDRVADRWKPWRAVAARILWHSYLNERGRASSI